jgi:uncharacterized membrane protein (UPF0127 family)
MKRFSIRAALFFLLYISLAAGASAADIVGAQPMLPHSQLIIDTDFGPRRLTVEMAMTAPQQEIGLMFRKALAPNAGMLFPFRRERNVSFWMKDTQIALDLLFIKRDGTIAKIAANAMPLSTANIPSGGRVKAVLEIPGGRAAQLGIKTEDKVRHFAN